MTTPVLASVVRESPAVSWELVTHNGCTYG